MIIRQLSSLNIIEGSKSKFPFRHVDVIQTPLNQTCWFKEWNVATEVEHQMYGELYFIDKLVFVTITSTFCIHVP
jgi:hypothetical protein